MTIRKHPTTRRTDKVSRRFFVAIMFGAFVLCLPWRTNTVFSNPHPADPAGQNAPKITVPPPEQRDSGRIAAGMFRPETGQASAFVESGPVKNMPSAAARLNFGGEEVPERGISRLFEGKALETVRRFDGASVLGGSETRPNQADLRPNALPTPSVNFEGISVFDTEPLGQGIQIPPDTSGEAGPNHYVQAVNIAFRVWDKQGTPLIPPISLGSLFANIPGPCAGSISGTPNVLYDQLADRWLISQRCEKLPGHMLIAVSKTADPTGSYYLYDFVVPNIRTVDSMRLGVWPDGYYLSDHQHRDLAYNIFRGTGFFALDRAKMLAGDPSASYIYFDSCPERNNCTVIGALPSDLDGYIPPPPGTPNVFALFTAAEYNDPQGDALRLFDFHADFANPSNSTFVERPESPVTVAPFDPVIGAGPLEYVAQPGVPSSSYLDPQSGRLMFRLAYRNFGSGRESLIANHTVDSAAQDRVALRYYQLDRSGPASPFAIAEQQTYSPDSSSRWMGSGAMNFLGDTAIGFSISSRTVFPSLKYAARLATDPPGSGLAQGEQTIFSGTGSQGTSLRRWGNYSDLTVDPSDDCSFWYTNEYYQDFWVNGWQTRIAKFALRECSVSPRGVIRGKVTWCNAAHAPLPGVAVDTANGFNRYTGLDGSYEMTVAPGVYAVRPKREGYTLQPSQASVAVQDGAAVTQDFCVMPVPRLTAETPAVVTGNGRLEPNECNSLRIPLRNDGAASSSVVSATLSSSTPGVTIPVAASVYPNIESGGGRAENATLFQIVTGSSISCPSTADLTLTVNYSEGPPIVQTIKVLVGQPTAANYVFTSRLDEPAQPSGTLVPGSRTPGRFSVPITAPFDFSVYGTPVLAGQTIQASPFGMLNMFSEPIGFWPANEPLPTQLFDPPAYLFVYWDWINMRDDTVQGGGIFTETTGQAPNRRFQIEWRGASSSSQINFPDTIVAVVFYENSDDFEFVYKRTDGQEGPFGSAANGRGATIGIQGNPLGTNFTQYSYNTASVQAGVTLRASRPAAVCTSGGGTCGQPLPTVSPTPPPAPFGFEGDVGGRTLGDGQLLSNDVTVTRRFALGLDIPDGVTNEFQRADSAPRETRGDGRIDSADVVQARRYVIRLDATESAGGPAVAVQ